MGENKETANIDILKVIKIINLKSNRTNIFLFFVTREDEQYI